MSLDRTTDSIAHFVGLFQLATEDNRLRKDYNEFKELKAKEDDATDYAFGPVRLTAPYELGDYTPHLAYKPKPDVASSGPSPAFNLGDRLAGQQVGQPVNSPAQPVHSPETGLPAFFGSGASFGALVVLPYVPIPSSAITITIQSIILFDNDLLGNSASIHFEPIEVFQGALHEVIELAEALQPWSPVELGGDFLDDPASALAFRDTLETLEAPDIDGVTFNVFVDEAAEGTIVNGKVAEEIPELNDQLPVFIRAKRDELNTEEDDQLAGQAKDAAFFEKEGSANASVAASAHNVVAGANETHNQVDIHTSWIDAGVIAVKGDVINLNAISQINILSDRDEFQGREWGDPNLESQAYNIASIVVNYQEELSEVADETSGDPLGFPASWNLERFEGDVTVANFIQQHTFATDHDRLELTFTAKTTTIVTGENQTYNLAEAGEFGFGYDLIFVGGTMLSLNLINQTNVLLDGDYFSGEGLGAAAISGNDNLLRNEAQITKDGADTHVEMLNEFKVALGDLAKGASDLAQTFAQSDYFQGMEALRVLYIEGNLTQMNIVDQINYLGDQDQVYMALDAMESALDDSLVTITTGSNLLTNTASILETGFDSDIMAEGEYYSDALLYQAELIDTNANPLGVGISSLASEAVAFLADDMMPGTNLDPLEGVGLDLDVQTGGTTFDVMQTMTA